MDGPGGIDAFFNHIHLKPELQLAIIANTKANHVYTVHYTLQVALPPPDPLLPPPGAPLGAVLSVGDRLSVLP